MTVVFRAAIIGTGRIGSAYDDEVVAREEPSFYQGDQRHAGLYTISPVNHAGAYRATPGFELSAAANRGEEKLRAFGERHGVTALYRDVRELLRQEQPDVVSVCTRSPEKLDVVLAAAEAGVKAIIVEKAMATSLAEADAMIEACDRHKVMLAVNHPNRFSSMNRQAKALIEAGEIGGLGTVVAHAGGGMLHVGTHTFDFMRYWAGDVVEIFAHVPDYQPEQDLPADGMVRFASGAVGFFDHSHRVRSGYEARGTKGSIHVSTSVGDGVLTRFEQMYPQNPRPYPMRISTEPIEGEPHDMSTTQRMLAELHATLSTGAPFISTGQDGRAALELGIACYASHMAGGPITLPLADRDLRVPNR